MLRLIEGLAAAGVESTLLARDGFAAVRGRAQSRDGGCEPLGLDARGRCELRSHDLVHAHDARTHTLAACCARAPLVVSRRVAFPVGSRWKYGRRGAISRSRSS